MAALQITQWLEDFLVRDDDGRCSLSLPPRTLQHTPIAELSSQLNHVSASLTSLNLSGNNIGEEGMKELAPYLENLSYLSFLDLYGNNIGDEGMKELAP